MQKSTKKSWVFSILCWVLIIASFIALVGLVLLNFILWALPISEVLALLRGLPVDLVPDYLLWFLKNMRMLGFGSVIVSLVSLVSAVGLIMRSNIARYMYLGFLALLIPVMGGIGWVYWKFSLMWFEVIDYLGSVPAIPDWPIQIFRYSVLTFLPFLIGFGAAILLLIWYLQSPEVLAEFKGNVAENEDVNDFEEVSHRDFL